MATHKRVTAIPSRLPTWYWGGDSHLATNWYSWYAAWGDDPMGECIPPTLTEFRARFPEFSDIPDETIQISIDDASCFADGSWVNSGTCQNCKVAIALLAAHFLASQLIMASALPEVAQTPGGGVVVGGGQVTRLSFSGGGSNMNVGFSAPKVSGGGGGGVGGTAKGKYCDFCETPYGSRYLQLLTVNQPAVVVV